MIKDFNNKILIIAGEPSGDMHASSLIDSMNNAKNNLEFSGIAGNQMINSGVGALFHLKDMAFLGFVEVIKHLPFILKVEKAIIQHVKENKIKLAILVDYPGFNLRIAKTLKKLGVRVIYYISPQIWAWHQSRINKIRQRVDKMLVVFPFEEKFYKDGKVPVEYVGHPLVERISNYKFKSKKEFCEEFEIDKEIFLILPGSRKDEIEKHLPELIITADKISKNNNFQIVVACADNFDKAYFEQFIKSDSIKVIKGNTYNLLKHSKFGIIKSGTSTLEAAIIGLPFVVIYSTSKLTYQLGKRLVKINNIAMPNIVAEKTIVREFIQDEVNADMISQYIEKLLQDEQSIEVIKNELNKVKLKLGSKDASKNAARIILSMIDET